MRKKNDKTGAAAREPDASISVAAHPRSASAVRRAKGFGGLLGMMLAMLLAMKAGLPALDVMVRGLVGGIAGYLSLWAVAVAVARQLVVAEVRARYAEVMRATASAGDADAA